MLLLSVLFLACCLLCLCVGFLRIARNARPLALEDYARNHNVRFIPVSAEFVAELRDWSKPLRLRVDDHRHPLLCELVVTTKLQDEPEQP